VFEGAAVDNILITEIGVATPPTSGTPGSYVFRLEDGQQAAGKVLTSDADGNATWQPAGAGSNQTLSISGNDLTISGGNTVTLPSGGGGGGGSYTFTNGLNESGGTVKMGGTISEDTDIVIEEFNFLTFKNEPGSGTYGDVKLEGDTRDVAVTNFDEDYIAFGGQFPSAPAEDGDIFTDSGSRSYRKDFVAGFHSSNSYGSGTSGGTAIQLGSIEHLMDGQAEVFINNDFNPLTTGGADLGSTSKRWGTLYAVNGTIQTSDLSLKENVRELNYGLNEILKLETITYKWKKSKQDNAKARAKKTMNQTKIGFSAQNLLEVLPETVSFEQKNLFLFDS
jgi:hypothetical protein